MAEADDAWFDAYQYETLPDAETYLRLLEFESDANDQERMICCRLTIWPMQDAPPYHAASYTWGSPSEIEEIYLDKKAVMVRKNCADVLRQLLFFQASRYYWIDALCVNQGDLREKGFQVAVMGKIYRNAQHVLACIGLGSDDDGDCAIQAISKIDEHIAEAGGNLPQVLGMRHVKFYDARVLCAPEVDAARYIRALGALSWRPYFRRLWVVQEVVLAHEVTFCSGFHRVSSGALLYHFENTKGGHTNVDVQSLFGGGFADEDFTNEFTRAVLEAFQGVPYRSIDLATALLKGTTSGSSKSADLDPVRVIDLCWRLQCEDRRDTIYATLSLIDWSSKTPIQPDYTTTAFALAVQAVECFGYSVLHAGLTLMLKLDENDIDVLRELELRRHLNRDSPQFVEPASFAREDLLDIEAKYSTRLCPSRYKIVYHGGAQPKYAEVFHSDGENTTWPLALLPPATEFGDRIVVTSDDHDQGAFVVRWTGTRFAIVGRVFSKMFFPHWLGPGLVRLRFDVEDIVLYLSIQFGVNRKMTSGARQSREFLEDMLAIDVCRSPFSSFAELLDDSNSERVHEIG